MASAAPTSTAATSATTTAAAATTTTVPDPWAGIDLAKEDAKLADDDVGIACVIEDEDGLEGALATCLAACTAAKGAAAAVSIQAADSGLSEQTAAILTSKVAPYAVDIDLSNCDIEEFCAPPALHWTRRLNLTGNSLEATSCSWQLPSLLDLSLAYTCVELSDLDLSPLVRLRKLNLSGCGIASLGGDDSPLAAVGATLEELLLEENDIEEADPALLPLAKLRTLRLLDIRSNPISEASGYEPSVRKLAPTLEQLDNKLLKIAELAQWSQLGGVAARMAAGDTVADQMEDRGSCSCLEGNPCLTPYTCKDWKHRFGIARQVREKSRKFAKATK